MINIMCIDSPISAPLYYVGEWHSSDVCDVESVQVLPWQQKEAVQGRQGWEWGNVSDMVSLCRMLR